MTLRLNTVALALSALTLALVGSTVGANEIYKTRDKDGNIVFTDAPQGKKAEKVDLPPINSQPPTRHLKIRADKKRTEPTITYTLNISSPSDQTTLTPGERDLAVSGSVSPKLQPGDNMVLLLNGQPYGPPSESANFLIQEITRGEHNVAIAVTNRDGRIIASSPKRTVYVIRPIIRR